MSEDGINTENPNQLGKPVALLGNRLGIEIKTPGNSFDLKNIFDPDASQLGGSRFTGVYFRTTSNNIYLISESPPGGFMGGLVYNARERAKKTQFGSGDYDPEHLSRLKITVGESFQHAGIRTTPVTEIVALDGRRYLPDSLRDITKGVNNRIIEDYRELSSPSESQAN